MYLQWNFFELISLRWIEDIEMQFRFFSDGHSLEGMRNAQADMLLPPWRHNLHSYWQTFGIVPDRHNDPWNTG